MLKRISVISILALLILTLTGCGFGAGKSAALGEQFTLGIGESETIRGENLKVTFESVLEDSRCPTGATCVWEGQATSLLTVVGSNTTELKLTEPGLSSSPFQYQFSKYTIFFHLTPYPVVNEQIKPDQYRLTMAVSKAQ